MHIFAPSDLEGDYLSIGYYLNGEQGDWMINGSLVEMDEKYGCDVTNDNLYGKIAAVTKLGKPPVSQRLKKEDILSQLCIEIVDCGHWSQSSSIVTYSSLDRRSRLPLEIVQSPVVISNSCLNLNVRHNT
jgi:hypothetical protein